MEIDKKTTGTTMDEKRVYLFYGITFGLAYILVLVLWFNGGLISAKELFPGYRLVTVVTTAYLMLPALGHILTRVITKEGWRHLTLRPNLRTGWKYWLLAWLGVPFLIAFGSLIFFLILPDFYDPELGHVATGLINDGIPLANLAVPISRILLLQALQGIGLSPFLNILTSLGGEFGWRGYLQPKLLAFGPRKALLITGASWGLFFAPLVTMGYTYGAFDLNYFGAPITGMVMIILACTYLGVVLGWMAYKADSIWPAVIGFGMITGVGEIALLATRGAVPLLLGPTVNGILGGLGFVIASILILTSNKALASPHKPKTSWKKSRKTAGSKPRGRRQQGAAESDES